MVQFTGADRGQPGLAYVDVGGEWYGAGDYPWVFGLCENRSGIDLQSNTRRRDFGDEVDGFGRGRHKPTCVGGGVRLKCQRRPLVRKGRPNATQKFDCAAERLPVPKLARIPELRSAEH